MLLLLKNFMGYFLYIAVIILGFSFKKSDRVTHIMSFYMWLIIAFNNTSADYYAYKEMYHCAFEPRYGDHEFGYMAICKVCLRLGMSYTLFRCFIAFIIVYAVVKAVKHYADRKNAALSMYLIFPFLGCASGLRQACANAFVLYGLRFLLEDGKKNTYKYVAYIMIAALFHYSSLFFLLCLYSKYSKSNNIFMAIKCIAVGISVIVIARTNIIFMLAATLTNREKTLRWLQLQPNFSGLYIISIFLFVLFLFVLYQAKVIMINRGNEFSHYTKINYKQAKTVSRCIIISLLAFVGAVLNSVVFLRLVLTLVPAGYAICVDTFVVYNADNVVRRTNISLYKYGMIVFCIACALFVYGFWIGGDTLKTPIGNPFFG